MASPFDFSSFLLTPPIPNYPSASEAAAQAAASNNASIGNNGNNGSNNLSSSLPNSTYPSALPPSLQYPSTQGYGNNAGVSTGSSSSSNNYMQQPQSQQQQYGNQQSMQSHASQSYQQPQQVQQQQQQSQPIQQPQYQEPQQQVQSAQQQQQNNSMYYTGDRTQNNNAVPYNQTSSSGYGQYQEPVQQPQQQQYPVQQPQQQQAQMMPPNAYMQNYGQQQTSRELPPVASGSSLRQQYQPQQQQQQQVGNQMPSLDERDYGLDPSAFSNVSFQMPSFLAASSQPSEYGSNVNAPPMVDPSAFYQAAQAQQPQPQQPQQQQENLSYPLNFMSAPPQGAPGQDYAASNPAGTGAMQDIFRAPSFAAPYANQQDVKAKKPPAPKYTPDVKNPVYGIYGSSVISINPDTSPFKLALNAAQNAAQSHLSSATNYADDSRSNTPDFDPKTLGLPVGDQLFPQPLPGLYSSSGFDMLGVLARVVARPNPQINIGPVDTSCAFLVVDARRYDMPIVFASDTFSKLTGYSNAETIGRNCRFLQAPDGHVAMGSRRKYTDGNAVYHLKSHIQSGKETQASIINYRKDGSPFINLVTVIPISWDTDEIAYFVGFQVDLVEQPNAILEKMKNGTYVVNYSLLPTNPPPRPAQISARQGQDVGDDSLPFDEPAIVDNRPIKAVDPTASGAAFAAAAHSSMTIAPELLEVMNAVGEPEELDDETAKKRWNKMLLDHTGDFVHVLSLKGSFLYVSPSVKSMLEYDASDLVGKTLQSVCHPSDIVPVMRELKESSNMTQPVINLLYRIRRKHSGYIWLEAQGKLYLEQSKSRKCVILVGRERPVYKLSWNDLRAAGGLGEKEFWSKVTHNGMFLYNTPTVKGVVGHDSQKLQCKSLYDLVELSRAPDLAKALADARAGKSVRLRYKLRNTKGNYVDVVTNFYPNSHPASPERKKAHGIVHASIVLQTNEYSSEIKRRASKGSTVTTLPPPAGVSSPGSQDLQGGRPNLLRTASAMRDMIVRTPDASDDGASSGTGSGGGGSGSDSSAPSTFSAIPSTYKTLLNHPTAQSDNLFDELDTTRTTSWQYELHQLKLTNKKLKEELAMLQAARRKRKKKEEIAKAGPSASTTVPASAPSANASSASGSGSTKLCANCGRTDSPEWRIGPTGVRNLCNACGLRWAKATKMHRQSSNTPSGNTSSSGNSDFEGASSFLQPAGPFAVQRPQLPHAESSKFNQSGH